MKRKNIVFFSAMMISLPGYAEVFKCKVDGKISYQREQCATAAAVQGVVKETPAQQVERDKLKLQAWQDQLAADALAKKEAEKQQQLEAKQRQDAIAQQESLELQRRSVAAQEQQAISAQKTPKTVVIPVPIGSAYNQPYWNGGYPPYPTNGPYDPHYQYQMHHHQHEMQSQNQPQSSNGGLPDRPKEETRLIQRSISGSR